MARRRTITKLREQADRIDRQHVLDTILRLGGAGSDSISRLLDVDIKVLRVVLADMSMAGAIHRSKRGCYIALRRRVEEQEYGKSLDT